MKKKQNRMKKRIIFKNGSQILLKSSKNNAERLQGNDPSNIYFDPKEVK